VAGELKDRNMIAETPTEVIRGTIVCVAFIFFFAFFLTRK
jgi:hypothetical protein